LKCCAYAACLLPVMWWLASISAGEAAVLMSAQPAALVPCSNAGIAISAADAAGAGGHGEVLYRLRNVSTQACRLSGYPRVRLLGQGFVPLKTVLHQGSSYLFSDRAHTVRLEPGSTAKFWLEYVDIPVAYPGWRCRSVPYLLLFLPGASLPIVARSEGNGTTLRPCSPVIAVTSFHLGA
jgi:hypothetical protein